MVLGRELTEAWPNRRAITGLGINDIDIARDIAALEVLEVLEVFPVGGICAIQFVVAESYDVHVLLFDNVQCVFALRLGGIVKTIALASIPSIDD